MLRVSRIQAARTSFAAGNHLCVTGRTAPHVAPAPVSILSRGLANAAPERMTMSLEDYQLKARSVNTKSYFAGVPLAIGGMMSSSYFTAVTFPEIYDPSIVPTPVAVPGVGELDPMFLSALGSSAVMMCSYAVGVSLFRRTWRLLNSDTARQMDLRREDLATRVYKMRAKTEVESLSDDFYGTSIRNPATYRQWLRTQRAKRKADAKYNAK